MLEERLSLAKELAEDGASSSLGDWLSHWVIWRLLIFFSIGRDSSDEGNLKFCG